MTIDDSAVLVRFRPRRRPADLAAPAAARSGWPPYIRLVRRRRPSIRLSRPGTLR
jgi:hypothetical protein